MPEPEHNSHTLIPADDAHGHSFKTNVCAHTLRDRFMLHYLLYMCASIESKNAVLLSWSTSLNALKVLLQLVSGRHNHWCHKAAICLALPVKF